jgi:hypothetical protein
LNLLSSLSIAAYSYAAEINFRVICINCNQVSVNVNGNVVPLTKYNDLPYFMGKAEASSGTKYHYVSDGTDEIFEREFDDTLKDRTYNDFYGRQETIKQLYQFGFPTNKKWNRSIGKQELFDDSYIPTIYIEGGLDFFKTAPMGTSYFTKMTFFLKDDIHYFTNVPVACKNRNEDKFQLRFGLPGDANNKTPLNRSILKLRASSEDPAFIRQLIYTDILHAIENPAHESVTVRVYSDGIPVGLYVLQEDVTTKSFIRSAFYGDEKTGKISVSSNELGFPLDCSTGADFDVGESVSSFKPLEGGNNSRIEPLREAVAAVDVNDKNSIENFSKTWFDLDIFFKALAVEYLAGHWDSYWYYTTNFVMYDDPKESTSNTFKYYFIDQDFDLTWGCGLSDEINRYGKDFPKKSYTEDVNRTWNIGSSDGPNRYAVDKFLSGGLTKGMFEAYLVSIVKHIFNPVAMKAKIDSYAERLRPELEWDYSFQKLYTSQNSKKYEFNIEDFDTGLLTGGKRHEWGILDWTEMRANAVCSEFGFEYDSVPLTPSAAEKMKVTDIEPIESGGNYEKYTGEKVTKIDPAEAMSHASSFESITKSLVIIVLVYLLI